MAKDKDIAISVEDVYKSFRLPHEQHSGIKQLIISLFQRKKVRGYENQRVLKGISFEIEKGDFFGIVGRNGSGKSTLLKILAGIYTPDKGNIQINGSLVPFIELGVGFNPELTGRENVFLNGALLGFNRKQMEAMYDEIVAFAEIGRFMDQKLKNYSSGMQVRLAFSIAIRVKSDILVLDEVLAVGDEAFQRKCYQYFAEIKKNKQTVILVTHSMDTILQFCNKAMLVDKGHKTVIGTPLEIAQIYQELNNEDTTPTETEKAKKKTTETKYVDASVKITNEKGEIQLKAVVTPKAEITDPVIAIGIYRDSGEQVYRWVSDEVGDGKIDLSKPIQLTLNIKDVFPVGVFTSTLYIKKRDRTKDYAIFNDVAKFEIKNHTPYQYKTFWKIPEVTTINGKRVE